jgi:cytidylate kinase
VIVTAVSTVTVPGSRTIVLPLGLCATGRTAGLLDTTKKGAAPPLIVSVTGVFEKAVMMGGVVMEGRDIGTVVFPNADLKIYLDASAEERARRRLNDPAHSGGRAGEAAVAASIQARDRSDTTRTVSPLTVAADAVLIDTTGVPIPDVVARVMRLVEEKIRITAP